MNIVVGNFSLGDTWLFLILSMTFLEEANPQPAIAKDDFSETSDEIRLIRSWTLKWEEVEFIRLHEVLTVIFCTHFNAVQALERG